MLDYGVMVFTIIFFICALGIYIAFIVLLFKLLLGAVKYFKLKNALMTRELYKPIEIKSYDYEAPPSEIEKDFKTV